MPPFLKHTMKESVERNSGANRDPKVIEEAKKDKKWLYDWAKEKEFIVFHKLCGAVMHVKESNGYITAISMNIHHSNRETGDEYVMENSFMYLVFKNFPHFKECYYNLWKKDSSRHFFEVFRLDPYKDDEGEKVRIEDTVPCRLFFDLDLKDKLYSEEAFLHPEALQDLEEIITQTLKECYPEKEIPPLDFVWSQSCRAEKESYHLTVKGLLFFEFREHYKLLFRAISYNVMKSGRFSYIPEKYFKEGRFLDKDMIKNALFRMVDSCKRGGVSLKLMKPEKYTLEDSLIRVHYVLPVNMWKCPTFRLGEFSAKKQEEVLRYFEPRLFEPYKEGGKEEEVKEEDLRAGFKWCSEKLEWFKIFTLGNFFGNFVYLNHNGPYQCPVCNEFRHSRMSARMTVLGEEGRIIFNCNRNEGWKKLGQLRESPKKAPAKKNAPLELPPGSDPQLELACKGDVGLAQVYCQLKQGQMFRVRQKKEVLIYMWNEKELLWVESHPVLLKVDVFEAICEWSRKKREELKALNKPQETEVTMKLYSSLETKIWYSENRNKIVNEIPVWLPENQELFKALDSIEHLLPVAGGEVVDLRTGEVRKRTREDYFTFEVPTKYNKNAEPLFEQLLRDDFLGNEEMVECVTSYFGYSITGCTDQRKMFVTVGTGANGKSIAFKLLEHTLDSPTYATGDKSIVNGLVKPGAPNSSLFKIRSSRIVNVPETEQGDRFNNEVVKRLTGGDSVACRDLHCSEITFTPRFKIWLATNEIPDSSRSEAFLERLVIVNFPCVFTNNPLPNSNQKQIDHTLAKKLPTAEYRESCLAALVRGAMKYFKEGLKYPKQVIEALEEYKLDAISVKDFINKFYIFDKNGRNVDLSDKDARKGIDNIPAAEIYADYCQYCKSLGRETMNKNSFGREMTKLKIPFYEGSSKKKYYYFIVRRVSNQKGGLIWDRQEPSTQNNNAN